MTSAAPAIDDAARPLLDWLASKQQAMADLLVQGMEAHDARPVAAIAAERNRKVPRAFAEIARIRATET